MNISIRLPKTGGLIQHVHVVLIIHVLIIVFIFIHVRQWGDFTQEHQSR